MASANNNTTGLASSMTVKNFQDVKAKMISGAVAKQNYRTIGMSNAKMNELRQYVYKMVSNWSSDVKMRIIAEHGDADTLKNKPSKAALNRQTTETLITNLKTEDLEILLRDIKADEIKLKKDISKYRSDKKRFASNFTTKSFDSAAMALKETKRPKGIARALKKEFKFKIPRSVKSQFKKLAKELQEVLKDVYDKIELGNLAIRMGIDTDVDLKDKEIQQFIINKTLMYVALIYGKTKFSMGGGAFDRAAYDELLSYTSYAFVTGRPGMSLEEVGQRRKEMMEARARQKEAFAQKKGFGIFQFGKKNKTKKIEEEASEEDTLGLKIFDNDGNFKGYYNTERMIELAGKYGIKIGGKINQKKLYKQIYKAYAVSTQKGIDANKKLEKLAGKGKVKTDKYLKAKAGTSDGNLPGGMGGSSIPTIFFSGMGEIASNISVAVPVFVVNDIIQKMKEKAKEKETEVLSRDSDFKKFEEKQNEKINKAEKEVNELESKDTLTKNEEEALKSYKKELDTEKNKLAKRKTETLKKKYKTSDLKEMSDTFKKIDYSIGKSGGGLNFDSFRNILKNVDKEKAKDIRIGTPAPTDEQFADTTTSLASENEDLVGPGMTSSKSLLFKGLTGNDPFVADLSNYNKALKLNNNMALRVFDTTPLLIAKQQSKKKKTDGSLSALLSSSAVKLKVSGVKAEPATPVFIVNKAIPTDVVQVLINIMKTLVKAIMPFGGETAAKAIESIVTGEDLSLSDILATVGFATGGRGQVFSKPKTHFISGDSLNKKPNPEQVSIDWAKKSYVVKPIPQFAEGGGESSTAGRYTRMTTTERSMPMSVGISSHTISYTRNLGADVKDEGAKQAIKVYSVNPGISDLIDVGGTSVSLIGLVADMTGRLASIEGLLAINNQQNQGIIAATTTTAANTARMSSGSKGGGNPFLNGGFPSDLNRILQGG
jgi:hypothetical protein